MSPEFVGVRPGLARRWSALCCPSCRLASGDGGSVLEDRPGSVRCAGCGAAYPVVAGIPDLRPGRIEGPPAAVDQQAVAFYEKVYAEDSYGRRAQDEHVEPLRRVLAGVPEDGFVLELGSGLGALQDVHPACVATDLSVEALARHVRGPAFASDAQCLPLRSGCVDALFSVAVLEHVPRPELALDEIARVLKRGGVAYLAPAWNCRPWAAEGLHVRPYGDLTLGQRARKATIPLRNSLVWRGAFSIPRRLVRRAAWWVRGGTTRFRYRRLEANFEVFWASDSDATAQLDPHETALYFESRGWTVEEPATAIGRIFHRAQPLVIRRTE